MAHGAQLNLKPEPSWLRSTLLRVSAQAGLAAVCLSVGFLVYATSVPQQHRLDEQLARLDKTKAQEREVRAERDACEIEHKALKTDPAYIENHARDRLDLNQPGERVPQFRPDRRQPHRGAAKLGPTGGRPFAESGPPLRRTKGLYPCRAAQTRPASPP